MTMPIWGIDLGGTKIEGAILPSLSDPSPLVRKRIPTEGHRGYDHIISQVATLVELLAEESGLRPSSIGFGTPGVLDPLLQTMKNCNTTSLNGRPLKKDLESRLGIPVVLANDANCFALAETHWGVVNQKATGARMVFGIILGTGVGGGVVIDGKIWTGKHGIAGEWGHNFLDASGGPCYCGKTGCVETVLCGPGLQRYYQQLSGKEKTLREIVRDHDDPFAIKTLDRLHYFFGKAAATVTNILDPDVMVIGGGVGNIESLYTEGLVSFRQFIFNDRLDLQILKPALGDSAGVFGAAALVA